MSKTFTYIQRSGAMKNEEGIVIAHGWAGNGAGKNNPDMQSVHSVGPLPQGLYKVGPWEEKHGHLGPIVAHLEQVEGETFGRDAFYIHGPSTGSNYGEESKGCIVLPRPYRAIVRALGPDFIRVVADA